jgi:integrase
MAIKPSTLTTYLSNFNKFLSHARLSQQQFMHAPAATIDWQLAVFIQHMYDVRQPYNYASQALFGAIFFRPSLKPLLATARQCLKGWDRNRHRESHPPLTWELTVVIACTFARSRHCAAAMAMLLGFDCYLRVGELLSLRRCDVILPNDSRMGQAHTHMAVVCKEAKTGKNQSVTIDRPAVGALLCHWLELLPDKQPHALVFCGLTAARFRTLMKDACSVLGVGDTPYVPHSLRHGGATADFLRTQNIEHVQFRGRWKHQQTARVYLQTARALLAALTIPPRINELGIALDADLLHTLQGLLTPPVVSHRVRFRL